MENESLDIDTIYDYAEKMVKSHEEAITRLDNRSTIFIGFGGTLLKLAFDLEGTDEMTVFGICFLCLLSILAAGVGISSGKSGKVFLPKQIMENDKYITEGKIGQQIFIMREYDDLIDEYIKIIDRKQFRINFAIAIFFVAIFLYALGIIGKGDELILWMASNPLVILITIPFIIRVFIREIQRSDSYQLQRIYQRIESLDIALNKGIVKIWKSLLNFTKKTRLPNNNIK